MQGEPGGTTKRDERRAAIVALAREHRVWLLRLARLLTADDADAEAAVRAACVRVYASWDGRREIDDAENELRIALMHVTRGITRPGRRKRVATTPPAENNARARVVFALQQLSARQRECVVLRHYLGFTESQIANTIGCSIGSVRTHYRRGMAHLTGQLDDLTLAIQ
jgi:RNA polymerase sigma factor (sigma-70 family)